MANITAARINNLQSSISLILGTGSGQNGYGQAVTSLPVNNTGDVVEAADMNAIYADILKARVHQVGVGDVGIAEVVQNLNIVAEQTSNFINDQGESLTDPDGFKKGIEDFESLMTQVQTDKALIHPSQAAIEPGISSTRSSTWYWYTGYQYLPQPGRDSNGTQWNLNYTSIENTKKFRVTRLGGKVPSRDKLPKLSSEIYILNTSIL